MATAPSSRPLPQLRLTNQMTPEQVSSELNKWAGQLSSFIQDSLAAYTPVATYTTTNGTGSRTLNVATATASQTADVVASLVTDLKKKGTIK